jgi:hypothetical protein
MVSGEFIVSIDVGVVEVLLLIIIMGTAVNGEW